MLDFYQTVGGRQFIDDTMPRIAKALEEIAKALSAPASPKVLIDLKDAPKEEQP